MCGKETKKFGSLDEIASSIMSCTKCPLHTTRTRAVPGEGPPGARLFLVGEAPGAHEDVTGRPFVGAAGRLLDKALKTVGLERSIAFVTNLVKCRPPGNRVPRYTEVVSCIDYLYSQLALVKPRVVVALGATAASYLIDINSVKLKRPRLRSITSIRGQAVVVQFGVDSFYLVPTYHPAGVLRRMSLWPLFVEDLRVAKNLLDASLPRSGRQISLL